MHASAGRLPILPERLNRIAFRCPCWFVRGCRTLARKCCCCIESVIVWRPSRGSLHGASDEAAISLVSGDGSDRRHGVGVVPAADRLGLVWPLAWRLLRRGLPALVRARVCPPCLLWRMGWLWGLEWRLLLRLGQELCDRPTVVRPLPRPTLLWWLGGLRLPVHLLSLLVWLRRLGLFADRGFALWRVDRSGLWAGGGAAIHGTVRGSARQSVCWWNCRAAGPAACLGTVGSGCSGGSSCRTGEQWRGPAAGRPSRCRRRPAPANGRARSRQARRGPRCLQAGCHDRTRSGRHIPAAGDRADRPRANR